MKAFAERNFSLSSNEDGRPYREILEGLRDRAEQKGNWKKVAELEKELAVPPLPKALSYIWTTYWRLRKRKAGNGFGPSPIEWPDIDAFVRNSMTRLYPWEIEFIEMIDDLFLSEHSKNTKRD